MKTFGLNHGRAEVGSLRPAVLLSWSLGVIVLLAAAVPHTQAANPANNIPVVKRQKLEVAGQANLRFLNDGTIALFQEATVPPLQFFHPRTLKRTGEANFEVVSLFHADRPVPLTADGKVFYALAGGQAHSLDVPTGKILGSVRLTQNGHCHQLSANHAVLGVYSGDKQQFYDTKTGRLLTLLPAESRGSLSPSGQFFVDSLNRTGIRLWSIAQGRQVAVYGPDLGGGSDLNFSPDEKTVLARVSADGKNFTYVFWDTATGKVVGKLEYPANDDVPQAGGHMRFSPDGNYISLLTLNGRLRVYSFPALQLIGDVRTNPAGMFLTVEMSPTEPLVAGLISDRSSAKTTEMVVWDVSKIVPKVAPPQAGAAAPVNPAKPEPVKDAAAAPAVGPDMAPPHAAGFRTWTSRDGKFQINAKLVSADGVSAKLESDAGKIIEVPLSKLSIEDRLFTRKQADPE